MKRLFLPLMAMLLSVNVAFAQDEPEAPKSNWDDHEGLVGFNLSQSYFNNWTPGGQNNVNFLGLAKYHINYKNGNHKWDNAIDLQLGYNYFNLHKKPIKTDDRIFLSSLYGYDVSNDKWFLTADFTFQTQFMDGFNYEDGDTTNRISGFMAPGYATLGLGIQWVPNEHFEVNIAPITGRLTIVNDKKLANKGAFGVKKAEYDEDANGDYYIDEDGEYKPFAEYEGTDPVTRYHMTEGKMTRWELGAQVTAEFKYEIFENVTFSSKLIAFYDYLGENENALGEKYNCPVDFDWDNALNMKINDWLTCNVTARLVYDEDITPIKGTTFRQFKEVLSLNISYKIP